MLIEIVIGVAVVVGTAVNGTHGILLRKQESESCSIENFSA